MHGPAPLQPANRERENNRAVCLEAVPPIHNTVHPAHHTAKKLNAEQRPSDE